MFQTEQQQQKSVSLSPEEPWGMVTSLGHLLQLCPECCHASRTLDVQNVVGLNLA